MTYVGTQSANLADIPYKFAVMIGSTSTSSGESSRLAIYVKVIDS